MVLTRAQMIQEREAEAKQRILTGWLAQIPGDRWRGTASEMAVELEIIADELGVGRWYRPSATGLTRWLADVEIDGWKVNNGRSASGRWIEFTKKGESK